MVVIVAVPFLLFGGGGVLVQHGTIPSYRYKTSISFLNFEVH